MGMFFLLLILVSSPLTCVAQVVREKGYPELPQNYDGRTDEYVKAACLWEFPDLANQTTVYIKPHGGWKKCDFQCQNRKKLNFPEGMPCDRFRVCSNKFLKGPKFLCAFVIVPPTGETSWMSTSTCGDRFFAEPVYASFHSRGSNQCQVDCYLRSATQPKIGYLSENTKCGKFSVCKSTGKKNGDGQLIRICVEDTPKRKDAEIRRLQIRWYQKKHLLGIAANQMLIAKLDMEKSYSRLWKVAIETAKMLDVVDEWIKNDNGFVSAMKELDSRKECWDRRNQN